MVDCRQSKFGLRTRAAAAVVIMGIAVAVPFVAVTPTASAAPMAASITLGASADIGIANSYLEHVECNSSSLCVATGFRQTVVSSQVINEGIVVAIRDGIPDPPQLLGAGNLVGDIACNDAHTCVATGPTTVMVTDGVVGAQYPVALGGIACPGPSLCYALMPRVDDQGAQVATLIDGVVTSISAPGRIERAFDISCLSTIQCMIVGVNPNIGRRIFPSAYELVTNGVIGKPVPIHGNQDIRYSSVNCDGPRACYVGGFYYDGAGVIRINPVTQRQSRELFPYYGIEADEIACPLANRCVIAGWDGLTLTTRTGYFRLQGGIDIPDVAPLIAVACASASTCVAVGSRIDPNDANSYIGYAQHFSVT